MQYTVQDLVNGSDLFLYLIDAADITGITAASGITASNAHVLAFATSCSLSISSDSIDASNKFSCRWQQSLPGTASYTVSADALFTRKSGAYNFDKLFSMMVAGDNIGWVMAEPTSASTCTGTGEFVIDPSKIVAWGEGVISSLDLTAGNGEVASCSAEIQGSGAPQLPSA